jgi:ribose transport system substrate-binding protein
MVAPMKAVMDSGIPIVTVDSDVNDPSARLGTVKSDGLVAGNQAADFANELLGGEGTVGYVGYTPGIQSVDVRLQGWTEQIATYAGIENVGDEYAGAEVSENVEKTSAMLSREPDLDVIFASWTNATIGAGQGVQQAGRDVAVIGMDASPDEVDLLERGVLTALVVQKPYDMGGIAIEELFGYVTDGTAPESETLLDAVIATQDNMDDPAVSVYFYTTPEEN